MTWDPEALLERCSEAMCETCARHPLEFPWGLFAWGDAPPAIGGGVGAFQWFKDLPELLTFVSDLSAAAFISFEQEADWLQLRDSLRQIAAGYGAQPEAARCAFNKELTSLLQIDWIGRFDDLIDGDGVFPLKVRAQFRNEWDDIPTQASTEAIKEDERPSFLDFLAEYGI